mmetsp:Transcript_21230/g.55222  ORF Transcript_21230/g.55222 Transcript_21230/m.55222 type:complete len:109 (-) Transcript_21230:324-650(-)
MPSPLLFRYSLKWQAKSAALIRSSLVIFICCLPQLYPPLVLCMQVRIRVVTSLVYAYMLMCADIAFFLPQLRIRRVLCTCWVHADGYVRHGNEVEVEADVELWRWISV